MQNLSRCFAILGMFLIASATGLRAETALEGKMDVMKKAFKELAKSLEQPVAADQKKYLELIARLHGAAVQSRDLTPGKAGEIPADKRPDFIKAYQKQMDETVALIDLLKKDVADSNWTGAQKQIAALKMAQKEGHSKFRSEEK
jgi:hypothetical protein